MITVYRSMGLIVEGLFFVVVTVYMYRKGNYQTKLEHILIRLLLINLQAIVCFAQGL